MGTRENAALFGLLLCLPTAPTLPLSSQSLAEKELSDFSPLWFLRGLRFYEGPQHVLD